MSQLSPGEFFSLSERPTPWYLEAGVTTANFDRGVRGFFGGARLLSSSGCRDADPYNTCLLTVAFTRGVGVMLASAEPVRHPSFLREYFDLGLPSHWLRMWKACGVVYLASDGSVRQGRFWRPGGEAWRSGGGAP